MRHSVVPSRHSVAIALTMSTLSGIAVAQSNSEQPGVTAVPLGQAVDQYFSHGADATSVPRQGPAADFFSHGADATSVNAMGPGATFFSRGADATSVHAAGPLSQYFTNGAQATSVPPPGQPGSEFFSRGADATSVPPAGKPGSELFSNGADATSVPRPGQLGSEYFSQGAEVPLLFPFPNEVPNQGSGEQPSTTPTEQPQDQQPNEAAAASDDQANGPEQPNGTEQPNENAPTNEAEENAAAPERSARSATEAAPDVDSNEQQTVAEQRDDGNSGVVPLAVKDNEPPSSLPRSTGARGSKQQAVQPSTFSKLVHSFVVGVSSYLIALGLLVTLLIAGLTWRMYSKKRSRPPLPLTRPT
jgi:hypothetical protein